MSKCKLVAIHDDLTIVGEPQEALRAFDIFDQLLHGRKDLQLQRQKCQLLLPSNPNTLATMSPRVNIIKRECASRQLPIVTGSIQLLGGIVGDNVVDCQTIVMNKVQSQQILFSSIQHHSMTTQIAYHLLRSCYLPRMGYLIRVVRPDWMIDACKVYDKMVLDAFINKCNLPLPLSSNVLKQIRLPCKYGGMGLIAAEDISPIAFYSAFSLAAINLPELPLSSTLHQIISQCHETFFDHGLKEGSRIPREVSAAMEIYNKCRFDIQRIQCCLLVFSLSSSEQILQRLHAM